MIGIEKNESNLCLLFVHFVSFNNVGMREHRKSGSEHDDSFADSSTCTKDFLH